MRELLVALILDCRLTHPFGSWRQNQGTRAKTIWQRDSAGAGCPVFP